MPQPVEIFRPASDPSRAVPILYSVGNLSTLLSHPATVLSLVGRMRLATGSYRGETVTRIASLELTPVALVGETVDGREITRLVPLAGLVDRSQTTEMRGYINDVAAYADTVIGTAWRETAP